RNGPFFERWLLRLTLGDVWAKDAANGRSHHYRRKPPAYRYNAFAVNFAAACPRNPNAVPWLKLHAPLFALAVRRTVAAAFGAVQDFTQALFLDPLDAEAFVFRASVLSRVGQHRAAVEDFSVAIKLNPDDHRPYLGRSWVYQQLGEGELALADANAAITLFPD